MSRCCRVLLEIFAPPFLGVAIWYSLAVWSFSFQNVFDVVKYFYAFVGFAYIIAGIPSLVYAAIMELAFSFGLSPRSWMAVLLSGLLGSVAGFSMIFFEVNGNFFVLDGLFVGLVIGAFIKRFSVPARKLAPG
jgi:hypothetical protein